MMQHFIQQPWEGNISSKFLGTSEVHASEILETFEEMFPLHLW